MPAGPSTHLSLLQRLRDPQNESAWFDFQHRYGELITRVGRKYGLQRSDCEDVMQEVLVDLTGVFEDGRYDARLGRFRNYLQTIAQRAIFRRFRQKRAAAGQTEAEGAPDAEASSEAERVWETEWRRYHLQRAMHTIEAEFSEINRLAFTFMTVNGKSAKQAADALGISSDRAYQANSRILRRLSELIETQVQEEG